MKTNATKKKRIHFWAHLTVFGFADRRHTNVHILIRVWYFVRTAKKKEEKTENVIKRQVNMPSIKSCFVMRV